MKHLLALFALVISGYAIADPCTEEMTSSRVTGVTECLLIREYGDKQPDALLIWVHGDGSSGGPANYHFPLASSAAVALTEKKVLSIGLVRPGYPDGDGNSSSVSFWQGGRSDHYTIENFREVIGVIQKLKSKYKPKTTVLVGHSGGAATSAVVLGMKPGIADAAILVACPCDVPTWRAGRKAWSRSESPLNWVDKLDQKVRVVALTGSKDDNTSSSLAITYINALKARGIEASFHEVADATHNSAYRAPEVLQSLTALLSSPVSPR